MDQRPLPDRVFDSEQGVIVCPHCHAASAYSRFVIANSGGDEQVKLEAGEFRYTCPTRGLACPWLERAVAAELWGPDEV